MRGKNCNPCSELIDKTNKFEKNIENAERYIKKLFSIFKKFAILLDKTKKINKITKFITDILFKNALNSALIFSLLSLALNSEKYLAKTVCNIDTGKLTTAKKDTMELRIP